VATEASTRVRVTLFGRPKVSVGQGEVQLSPHQRSLIVLVFGHSDDGISRPEASWLLWERDPDPVIRHRLRQLLSETTARIGIRIIRPQGDILLPDYSLAESDEQSCRVLISEGHYSQAAGYLKLGLATGIESFVSRAYEDWARARARTLKGNLIREASASWDLGQQSGDWLRALDAARALHSLRPNDVTSISRLMKAHVHNGQATVAEAVYSH